MFFKKNFYMSNLVPSRGVGEGGFVCEFQTEGLAYSMKLIRMWHSFTLYSVMASCEGWFCL